MSSSKRAVVRTGEFSPYANVILVSGVVFLKNGQGSVFQKKDPPCLAGFSLLSYASSKSSNFLK
jgi:hypothetical protein